MKKKHMYISRNEEQEEQVSVADYKFKRTDQFKYKEVTIKYKNKE